MNQTSATVLILASAVFSNAANLSMGRDVNQASVVLTLAALAVGVWGALGLIAALVREREMFIDNHARLDLFDRLVGRQPKTDPAPPVVRSRRVPARALEISPDLQAQLAAAAELEGRDHLEILEETLRRHLPKYNKPRAA
jgi:hypothetical protein